MAMSSGGDSNEGISEINVTPLIDIMLVMLIIFFSLPNRVVDASTRAEGAVGASLRPPGRRPAGARRGRAPSRAPSQAQTLRPGTRWYHRQCNAVHVRSAPAQFCTQPTGMHRCTTSASIRTAALIDSTRV